MGPWFAMPRWRSAIAFVARHLYDENYVALPTRSEIDFEDGGMRNPKRVCYSWKFQGEWSSLTVSPSGDAAELVEGSEEEFITEHYWGYTRHNERSSSEYRVEHPRWRVWQVDSLNLHCDIERLYGPQFKESICGKPSSAFLAEGSEVAVYRGVQI